MLNLRPMARDGVEIMRRDAGRRVVYGEVMVAAPQLSVGQEVAAADLVGRVHYDGGYMVADEVQALADVFARKRPSIDVEHDGIPRAAAVVESFVARAGWAPYTEGSWVVGVQIYDDELWGAVEREELRAFSVHFLVRVRPVPVLLRKEDGTTENLVLREFSNANPQFLSLVKRPATGAIWKEIDRTAVALPSDLPVAPPQHGWDPEAAMDRVRRWAAEHTGCAADAFVAVGRDGGGLLVGDVIDGELVVVRSACEAAAATAESLDRGTAARVLHAIRRYVSTESKEAAVEVESKQEAMSTEDATETVESAEETRSAGEEVAEETRSAGEETAEEATASVEDTTETVESAEETRAADEEVAEEEQVAAEEDLAVVARALDGVTEDTPPATILSRIRRAFGFGVKAAADTTEDADGSQDGDAVEDVQRAPAAVTPASVFASKMAAREVTEMLWESHSVLVDSIRDILDGDTTGAFGEIRQAVLDYAQWLINQLEALSPDGVASLLSEMDAAAMVAHGAETMQESVRAGRKMATARLAKLRAAVNELTALIAELSGDDQEPVERSLARGAAEAVRQLEAVTAERDELQEQLRALRAARPAPAVDTDLATTSGPEPEPTRRNIVRGIFF